MPFGFRADGDRVKGLSPTRAIMPFLFPTRTEAQVFFELAIDATRLTPFLEEARAKLGVKITLLHLVIAAAARALDERPRLNRFVCHGVVYQRRGIWISFSAKTEKTDRGAVVALKRRIDPSWDLKKVFEATDALVGASRAGRKNQADRELALALALPGMFTRLAVWFLRALDRHGLMPRSMIDGDPLFSSLFVANLGSIGMDAPFHHLYEWGNIPLFLAIGTERQELSLDRAGAVRSRPVIPFRFTFDERVEDGLYCLKAIELLQEMLEDPAKHFPLP
jgi:hypothetical protein